jgi:hypothetical protein
MTMTLGFCGEQITHSVLSHKTAGSQTAIPRGNPGTPYLFLALEQVILLGMFSNSLQLPIMPPKMLMENQNAYQFVFPLICLA